MGDFLNVSMVLGSIIKIKFVESIGGDFYNISVVHWFHIKYSECGIYQG